MNKQKREPLSFAAAVPRVIEVLSQNGHRHALIGGLAVGVWVEPRATKDIDFVVSARIADVDDLCEAMREAGFDIRTEEVHRLKQSHMTRLWATDSNGEPFMIDLLLDEHPFYDSLLDRSRPQRFADHEVRVASPEDLLLLKVLAGRPQDIVDAARLVETCGAGLDRAYLEQWAQELGIESELHRALG